MTKDLNGNDSIRAYSEMYLDTSTRILGDAFDYAVNSLGYSLSDFAAMFAMSKCASQFENGNPSFIAGINGCELARKVIKECEHIDIEEEDAMYLDKSPEYWVGYISAYYQWFSDEAFSRFFSAVSTEEMLKMYDTHHEMDIMQMVKLISKRVCEKYPITRLAWYRKSLGLTQRQLAKDANVPLRQIQLFEQRERNINKAQFITVFRLSKALNCDIEDLFDREYYNEK